MSDVEDRNRNPRHPLLILGQNSTKTPSLDSSVPYGWNGGLPISVKF